MLCKLDVFISTKLGVFLKGDDQEHAERVNVDPLNVTSPNSVKVHANSLSKQSFSSIKVTVMSFIIVYVITLCIFVGVAVHMCIN